jgi:putative FmdB family regulatory protein
MAVYEYKCQQCDNQFELSRSILEDIPMVDCEECGSPDTKRVWTPPGVKFNGTGWGREQPKPPGFVIEDHR